MSQSLFDPYQLVARPDGVVARGWDHRTQRCVEIALADIQEVEFSDRCFRKKMEDPLEKIVDALTGFSPFIWVGTLFFCIGILENVYLGITTHVGGNGPKNALFVNGASFVWLLVPLITYASWPKAHEIHAKSGPLSWPLYKLFTLGAKKIGAWTK